MPEYQTSGGASLAANPAPPTALWPGDWLYPLGGPPAGRGVPDLNDGNVQFEAVNAGERSVAWTLAARPGGGSAPGIMVQVFANANPGAAEIDVQDAGIDADGAYLTDASSAAFKLTAWTQLGGSAIYTAWTKLEPEAGVFQSLKVVANPNGVSFWAKVFYV